MTAMQTAFEASGCVGLAWAFLSIRVVRVYVSAMPVAHRWMIGMFCVLLMVAQFINQPRLTFPFASWTMYGKPEQTRTLVFYRYQGAGGQGDPVEIDPFALLSPIHEAGVASKIKDLAKQAESHLDEASRKLHQERLKALLRAIGRIYNYRHPKRALQAVTLIRCSIDLRQGAAASIHQEPLMRVKL